MKREFSCEFDRVLAAGIELWKRKDCGKEPDGEWKLVGGSEMWTPSWDEQADCCLPILDRGPRQDAFYNHAFSLVHIANLFGTGEIQDMLRIRKLLIQGYEPVIEQLWQTVKIVENATKTVMREWRIWEVGNRLMKNPPVVEPAK